MPFIKNIRSAVSNVYGLIAKLLSAIAIFNFIMREVRLGFSDIFERLIQAYRTVFYPVAEFLLGWAPFYISDWIKDALVIWLAIGGASATSLMKVVGVVRSRGNADVGVGAWQYALLGRNWMEFLLWSLFFWFLWPLAIVFAWRMPIIGWVKIGRGRRIIRAFRNRKELDQPGGVIYYDHDLRWVFLIQLMIVVASVIAMMIFNWMGL